MESSKGTNSNCNRSLYRYAFTLIEFVVVLAVVAFVVALTMPAVNHVREGSRRINCESNIRQLGAGMLLAEQTTKIVPHNGGLTCDRDAEGKIPGSEITAIDGRNINVSVTYLPDGYWPLGVGDPKAAAKDQPGSWAYATLPFIEHQAAFLGRVYNASIPSHHCPSRHRLPPVVPADDSVMSHVAGGWAWTKTDYAASSVIRWRMDPQPLSKYMSYGLDNVVLLGEKARHHERQSESNWFHDEPIFSGGSRGGTSRSGRLFRDEETYDDMAGFGSGHPAGINFVYFSGRTGFVSFNIDSEVLDSMFPNIPFTNVACPDPRPSNSDGT